MNNPIVANWMRVLRFVSCAATLGILCACAAPPQYTVVDDPFKSLSSKAPRLQVAAKLCLMLTDNSRRTFEYLDGMRASMAGSLGAMSGFDSQRLVADINGTLQSRFLEVTQVDAVGEIAAHGCHLAMSLDLEMTLSPGIQKQGLAKITATIGDANGTVLDELPVAASRQSFGSIGEAAAEVWVAAIAELGERLDQSEPLLAYGAPVVTPPSTASNGQVDASVAIELAFWNSIKDSSQAADFQAYLRKYPNGSFEGLARSRLLAIGEPAPLRTNPIGQPTDGAFNFGSYHALVIGNNNYRYVTPLNTSVIDAEQVADVLANEYGFEVTLLRDATRDQMLDAFDDLRRNLTENDNLLIYYAGHGYLDTDSDRGFWLPVDADANRRANWLSNSDLADMVRATRAKHVLVVADSCYAGTLTRGLMVQMTALDDYARLSEKRARTALTSGGMEPVEDGGGGKHSIFAKAFLAALQANTGVVDMSQIFSSMRREVILGSQQTPQYGDIRQTGHEGGDFIFVRRSPGH